MARCVNIDWLEVYALEPLTSPRNADYFRKCGWEVHEREYGTPMYHEMFTLIDERGNALFEIRRDPKSRNDQGGLFDINGCHIRLTNRTCYFKGCAEILQQFMLQYSFTFSRISRIDICLDFKRFDSHDYPNTFIRRFMEGKYSKINQAELTAHGRDDWGGRCWNSLSWGRRKSMIRTRLYCKSLELQEVKDKPYIRQAWFAAGLVDNPLTCISHNADGSTYKPDIWRLEFQISSSVKRWFVINPDGQENVKRSIHHTLSCYYTDEQLLTVFDSLQRHYFHFKYYDSHQRKDRCRDKVLFDFGKNRTFYKIARDDVASTAVPNYADQVLLRRLQKYREEHQFDEQQRTAAQIIIDALDEQKMRYTTATPYSREQLAALRMAIHDRLAGRASTPMALEKEIHEVINTTLDSIFLDCK